RDLFDVHGLFQHEGITDAIRRAFVVMLASHDRPINELLTPNRKDLKQVYADQFSGMTLDPVPLAVLEETRERLITHLNAELTLTEREFLPVRETSRAEVGSAGCTRNRAAARSTM